MNHGGKISRRTVLRGLGTAIALPWLEAMAPVSALAGGAVKAAGPRRMAFLYVPNGVHLPHWTPGEVGPLGAALPRILEPLTSFKDSLLVLSGLAQDGGRAHGDGPGDHARALGSFLTGTHPKKTDGADIKVGISVDQYAAEKVGKATRFPSLELGVERGGQSGNCDSGYSCAYSSNISWRSESVPAPKEINPRLVFERLFATNQNRDSAAVREQRRRQRKSILDFVMEDATNLQGRVGRADSRKVDEYLTSIRELERRIVGAESLAAPEGFAHPVGIPKEMPEHIKLMFDLLALAFQADLTRIATFTFANEGSTRPYPFLGVPEGHHDLSHHGRDPKKQEKLSIINRFHVEQFAYLLDKLRSIPEGEGTVLDNSMIVYGSGLGDGDRHNHDNLPILLAGKGGGTIQGGRHIKVEKETPLNNLFLSMLDRIGAPADKLGDSNGKIEAIAG